jgi:hypothetical protein
MQGLDQARRKRAPAHLWVVGGLSLLWNLFGCIDYVLTNLREPSYVAAFPPGMIDMLDAFPSWVTVAWGIGVGCALWGSVLLLAGLGWAELAFLLSLLGLAASQLYQFVTGLPPEMNTVANWGMTAVIWIIAVGQMVYTARMRARGVLR